MPVCQCSDMPVPCSVRPWLPLPVPSAPIQLLDTLPMRTCRPTIKIKKKKKEVAEFLNLEKLIIALHSEPRGGLIKNIHLLG